MNNKFFFFVACCFSLSSMLFGMQSGAHDARLSQYSNSAFDSYSKKNIDSLKKDEPYAYFNEKINLAHSLNAGLILLDSLLAMKNAHDVCKNAQWASYYDKKYITGVLLSIPLNSNITESKIAKISDANRCNTQAVIVRGDNDSIKTDLECRHSRKNDDGDQFQLCLSAGEERSFVDDEIAKISDMNKYNKHTVTFYDDEDVFGAIIKTDLGYLHPRKNDNEDQFQLCLSTGEERSFVNKVGHLGNSNLYKNEEPFEYVQNYTNSENEKIKILASNLAFFFGIDQCNVKMQLAQFFSCFIKEQIASKSIGYKALELVLAKELNSLCPAVEEVYKKIPEGSHQIFQALLPLCGKKMIWEGIEKKQAFFQLHYGSIVKELCDDFCVLANMNQVHAARDCTRLIDLYFCAKRDWEKRMPERLVYLFKSSNYLEGIDREVLVEKFCSAKSTVSLPTKKQSSQKNKIKNNKNVLVSQKGNKRERGAFVKKADVLPVVVSATTTASTSAVVEGCACVATAADHDTAKPASKVESILYDNRVLTRNKKKEDRYHGGFPLAIVPYIKKYGTCKKWTNRTTGHQDDHYTIYGEITDKATNSTELVVFEVCEGADNVVYHVGMRKNNSENSQAAYNAEYPPLKASAETCTLISSDGLSGSLPQITDYMIRFNITDAEIVFYI